ncbi:MAG: dihydrolipoyl dehydrogenase [Dehalococcoidia bacterium]
MPDLQVVVIGGGPGGYVAAIRAAQLGLRVALVEREALGGLCLNWGCIPSKALIHAADVLNLFRGAGDLGISYRDLQYDLGKAVDRSRRIVDQMTKGVEYLLRKNNVPVYRGEAFLRSPREVEVRPQGEVLAAEHLIIATGARARTLPGVAIDGQVVITSREALALRQPPSSLVVVGGGSVGVELAYLCRTYGSQVTIVEMLPHLLPGEDEEISRLLERAFQRQGIQVMTAARVEGITVANGGATVHVATTRDSTALEGEKVLMAVGMEGNWDALGLEALGVMVEKGFIPVDDRMATNIPGIYAVGDVSGPPLLAHVAMAQGVVAAEGIASQRPPRLVYEQMPRATYCQPQVASIGLTEAQAQAHGHQVKVGRFPFRANGKALALGERDGIAKLVANAETGEILGCHMIGPEVTELLGEVSLSRLLEATPDEVGLAVHPHPTLSEVLKEAALAVGDGAIHI